MERYREQLASAVGAVVFTRGDRFLWRGASSRSLPHRILAALSPTARRSATLLLVREKLYEDFYCHGGLTASDFGPGASSVPGAPAALVAELSRANAGVGSWERGWTWLQGDGDDLVVARDGLALRVSARDIALDPGVDAHPGSPVALRVANELPKISPGYYFALGNEAWADAASPLVRVYWNLTPEGAVRLVRATTSRFNDARIAFRLKALDDPAAYTRCDAAVLYLRKDVFGTVSSLLLGIHQELRPFLKAPIPAFTKDLAPGLGLAEDPATGDSFGMSRCQWVAEGLLLALDVREQNVRARVEIVERHLREKGVDPDKPYLNPGSVDRYDLVPSRAAIGIPWRRDELARRELRPAELLLAASRIGDRIAESAIWTGHRVGWVGLDSSRHRAAAERETRHSALGPDLYAGTTGLALFLAELSAASGAPTMRSLALAAVDHALTRAEAGASSDAPGLFDGWSGVALVGARVGLILDDPKVVSRARSLVHRWDLRRTARGSFDLMSGKAGLILALLILSDLLHEERLRDQAARLGDLLLETAERDGDALSWRGSSDAGRRNLTGFSHGAAGAAYALLELYRATGIARFREGADSAIAYEQRWFDPSRANWPDFRKRASPLERRAPGFEHPSHWCHGAAGIALSRLRAWEVLGTGTYEEQARVALATTAREAERRLSWGTGDLSLCHGLAGDAEVLLCGSRVLAPSAASPDQSLQDRLAAAILQRLGLLDDEPSSPGDGFPLGLMSGLAGAGHFLLRLRDERVPSVLMPRREDFSAPPRFAHRSNPSASQTSGC